MNFSTIQSEGSLISADLLMEIASGTAQGQQPADFGVSNPTLGTLWYVFGPPNALTPRHGGPHDGKKALRAIPVVVFERLGRPGSASGLPGAGQSGVRLGAVGGAHRRMADGVGEEHIRSYCSAQGYTSQ